MNIAVELTDRPTIRVSAVPAILNPLVGIVSKTSLASLTLTSGFSHWFPVKPLFFLYINAILPMVRRSVNSTTTHYNTYTSFLRTYATFNSTNLKTITRTYNRTLPRTLLIYLKTYISLTPPYIPT